MTYTNFKDLVCSYNNRLAALFATVGAQDVVLAAMNDARRQAQRKYKFNLCKRQAFVNLSILPQTFLSDFKSAPAGSTTVVVSRLDSLWEYGSATVASTTAYYPTRQVDTRRSPELSYAVPQRPWPWQGSAVATTNQFAYCIGPNVYHSTLTTQTWHMAYVVEFLPDLTSSATTDVFLDYFTDWLKFATIANLNVWLKDSERFNIDANTMATLWESVVQYDSQQETIGDINLD